MEATITVVDALVAPADFILAGWGPTISTDENTSGMDDISFSAVAGVGSFELTLASRELFVGTFKVNYVV